MYVFIYCSTVYIFNKKFYISVLHNLSCIKSADILERQQLIVESFPSHQIQTLCVGDAQHQLLFLSSIKIGKLKNTCLQNSPNESSLLPLALAAPVVQLQLSCPGQKSWAVCFLAPQGEVSVSPSKLQGGRGDKQVRFKGGCLSQNCGIILVVTRVRWKRPGGNDR